MAESDAALTDDELDDFDLTGISEWSRMEAQVGKIYFSDLCEITSDEHDMYTARFKHIPISTQANSYIRAHTLASEAIQEWANVLDKERKLIRTLYGLGFTQKKIVYGHG